MKITIFFKTFLTLLISFSILLVLSTLYFYNQFSDRYIEENIEAVKNAIINSQEDLVNSEKLENTLLSEVSSETTFIRYTDGIVLESIGPQVVSDEDLLEFVIELYDSEDLIQEGKLSYTISLQQDIYNVSYIYRFSDSDYLLILTKIQSLRNIDLVLNDITLTQALILFVTIIILSFFISKNIAKPVKQINNYAKAIAKLDFSKNLTLKRKDEFREVISSLNEMAFNLKKTYYELEEANKRLENDIEYEKHTEKRKKALIMTINHELKTPLSVIKGMVEGMIDGVGRFKNKEKYLLEVISEIEKIEVIAKDLTYSLKLEDIAKEDDITNILTLKTSLKSLKELAVIKNVKLNMDIIDCQVCVNEEMLGILVANLLKNAINYTLDKTVYLKTYEEDEKILIIIKNKGHIEENELERIFEPYYRVDLGKDGSGLGLFIVKQICDLYDFEYRIFNDSEYVISKIIIDKNLSCHKTDKL
ncbi:MAG: HAMP domain-containing sensor histidine kinase [Candidatus Izemoplasmatales bacterium]